MAKKNKNMVPLSKVFIPYITHKIWSPLSAKKLEIHAKFLNIIHSNHYGKQVGAVFWIINEVIWNGRPFSLPFQITKNTKLQRFQFRNNHRILATNSLLHKMKKVDSYNWSFCKQKNEAIEHMFWESIQGLLNDFAINCFKNILTYVVFAEKEFILGSHEN